MCEVCFNGVCFFQIVKLWKADEMSTPHDSNVLNESEVRGTTPCWVKKALCVGSHRVFLSTERHVGKHLARVMQTKLQDLFIGEKLLV